jgi:AraC-like DNA-binding protein
MLDVAAVAYSGAMKTGTIQPSLTTRRIAIVNYIEQHLREPDLAPESIAAAFRMSSRYLHRLFDTDSESLAKYIRRRRIEESARLLASPLQRRRSISEIAYDFGFSSLAHFSKIFREHHGMSPTDYRQNALASGEPAHERALPAPLSGG